MNRFLTGTLTPGAAMGATVCHHDAVSYLKSRLPAGAVTVLAMLVLKYHYSTATADHIDWILAPTARLVALLTSVHPVWEAGVGYVDFSRGIIVAPACAGINFMIMAFGLAAFCGMHWLRRPTHQAVWLLIALGAAYGLALAVNTVRIALSMSLYQADIYSGWITVERVHRLTGVAIYLAVLWAYFLGLRRIAAYASTRVDRRTSQREFHLPNWLPPALYLLGAVGVPLAHRAWQHESPSFYEHCATVILATLAFYALVKIICRILNDTCACVSGRLTALCRENDRRRWLQEPRNRKG